MKSTVATTLLLLLFVSNTIEASRRRSLSESDKVQIMWSILLNKHFLGDNEMQKSVCLSTENIPPKLLQALPRRKGVEFKLVTRAEIEQLGKCSSDFWSFGRFRRKGESVLIVFTNGMQHGGFSSDHGFDYEYRKIRGVWKLVKTGTYFSMS
jgi:hypothetical protein